MVSSVWRTHIRGNPKIAESAIRLNKIKLLKWEADNALASLSARIDTVLLPDKGFARVYVSWKCDSSARPAQHSPSAADWVFPVTRCTQFNAFTEKAFAFDRCLLQYVEKDNKGKYCVIAAVITPAENRLVSIHKHIVKYTLISTMFYTPIANVTINTYYHHVTINTYMSIYVCNLCIYYLIFPQTLF